LTGCLSRDRQRESLYSLHVESAWVTKTYSQFRQARMPDLRLGDVLMTTFIIRRLFQSVILLFFVSILIYIVINIVPGGPFDMLKLSNPRLGQSHIDRLNALLDLDKPLLPGQYCPKISGVQQPCRMDQGRYVRWLGKLLRGDMGESWTLQPGAKVIALIWSRLGYTVLLMGLSLFLAIIIAVPIGIYSAVKQYSISDYIVTALAFFGQSMPTFWTGLMAMAIFAVNMGWFPTSGVRTSGQEGDIVEALSRIFTLGRSYPELAGKEMSSIVDGLRHIALPCLVLTYYNMAGWARFTRASMLEVLRQDYMRTARAKGLKERLVILKHGLRNALIPLITILALTLPSLFGGAIITETIFSWPGIGRMQIDAINRVDWPVVQGLLVIEAFLVIFSNLLADIMYAVVDPRIQYS
jgi:peptide/nickel transport system permease protein